MPAHDTSICSLSPSVSLSLYCLGDGLTGIMRTHWNLDVFPRQDKIEQCCVTLAISSAWPWQKGEKERSNASFHPFNLPLDWCLSLLSKFVFMQEINQACMCLFVFLYEYISWCRSNSLNRAGLCTTKKPFCCPLKLFFWSQQSGELILAPILPCRRSPLGTAGVKMKAGLHFEITDQSCESDLAHRRDF